MPYILIAIGVIVLILLVTNIHVPRRASAADSASPRGAER